MNTARSSGEDPLTEPPEPVRSRGRAAAMVVLRVLAAAALAVDAVVHARLAPAYQSAAPEGFGEGNLFLAEAAAAALAGLYVLIRASRTAWFLALLTAGGGLAVLLLYRYVDIPAVGPFPAMYEPVWFFDKTLTALAQTAAVLLAATALAFQRRTPDPAPLARGRNRGHDDS
ncbi:hypothetical protein J7I84_06975 [Arthrobacter sp. ISL-85]|uniref:hypothetical protein n=1 Tax=Arthrobacter sp. ISL-85 TaxID=2819115 RepID=UPI001BEC0E85|nr:hypothetical protein [Arthrobacter sp. ISL-85]MBT2566243.1 hypothetical protein [Arthrobacter sp. ISL-85]